MKVMSDHQREQEDAKQHKPYGRNRHHSKTRALAQASEEHLARKEARKHPGGG